MPHGRSMIAPTVSSENSAVNDNSAPYTSKSTASAVLFDATQVCKPGSVLTAIYLLLQLLTGSSRLLEAVGQTICFSTALLRDRVYSVKPMLPWAGWALTPPFHPYLAAVYFCCTCPEVTLGGRYPLSLPCGARTFLIRGLSATVRGCPTWSRKYCNRNCDKCQTSCKFFWKQVYYNQKEIQISICRCVCTALKNLPLGEGGSPKG